MNLIGIVCASDTELQPFLSRMTEVKITEKAMLTFYEGTLGGVRVVALYSGVCKVNAAIATQLLITCFQCDVILNAGTAGGMKEGIQLFDTVISEQVAYHDVADDILTEFHPWLKTIYFDSDHTLLAMARKYSATSQYPILFGKTITGEQFVEDRKREELNQKFAPLSTDMETASIAHVCYVNQIPFLAIRTITDTATHSGIENFDKNSAIASAIAADICIGLLENVLAAALPMRR